MSSSARLVRATLTELTELQRQRPAWLDPALYADPNCPLGDLRRREAARLLQLARATRSSQGERTRERARRERTRPWEPKDRWLQRKLVWRERRDRERELLDWREQAVLARDAELQERLDEHRRWVGELAALEPQAQAWCEQQLRRNQQEQISIDDLNQVWERRRRAALHAAAEALDLPELRTALAARAAGARSTRELVAAVPTVLAGHPGLPQLPVLYAAIVMLLKDA